MDLSALGKVVVYLGLGLSVCHTIIVAHRGKLWATNNVDRGATFHFSLPINGSEAANN